MSINIFGFGARIIQKVQVLTV